MNQLYFAPISPDATTIVATTKPDATPEELATARAHDYFAQADRDPATGTWTMQLTFAGGLIFFARCGASPDTARELLQAALTRDRAATLALLRTTDLHLRGHHVAVDAHEHARTTGEAHQVPALRAELERLHGELAQTKGALLAARCSVETLVGSVVVRNAAAKVTIDALTQGMRDAPKLKAAA